jgi:hypothetical protein
MSEESAMPSASLQHWQTERLPRVTADPQACALVTVAKEDRSMSENARELSATPFNLQDRVKIRHSRGLRGQIVEVRGPIGPGGVPVYRVVVRRKGPGTKPIRTYIDLMKDQLERIPAKA